MLFPRRFFLSLPVAAGLICCALAAPKPAPNVVVITVDTLRADHLGCYGYKQIKSPNIDALAAVGTRFARAYTPVPVTLPAHTAIFTGTYPMYSGVHDFSANELNPAQPTLASVLQAQGYATAAVIGSAVLDSRFGLNHGFGFYYDHFDFSRLDEANLDAMKRAGNVVADVTLDWLSKNSQEKFFLWMHLYDPHYPYRPPPPYSDQYPDRPYDGEIAFADEQVGRLIRFLKAKGLYQNTLIVLCGDHGESLGEHGEKTHGFFIYNATLHVPLIVHLPGETSSHSVDQIVSLTDLMPTVLQAVKVDIPAPVQGISLLPAIEGASQKDAVRSLYAETFLPRLHFNWSELRAVETGTYHFIDAPKPELYDLIRDPGETRNLFPQKKAVSEELRARLADLIRKYSAGQELAEKTGLDPVLMERLKSLGYAAFSGGSNPTVSNRDLPDPKDRIEAYELFSDAMADSQHGRYADSVAKLNVVLKSDPDSIPTHYLLGLNYYRMGQFPSAVEHLERVMQLSPDYALASYHLGLAYAQSGQQDRAITTFKHTLELDPTNFAAAYNLGAAFLRTGVSNRTKYPALKVEVEADTLDQVEQAVAGFRQSALIRPDYPPAHLALGEVLLYQGKLDDALAESRRAVELAPDDPAAHAVLARALKAKGMDGEAAKEMEKAGKAPGTTLDR
jgi:arylsulfatase A-like enzyme/Flp pilus assembly protein TadD